MDRRRVPTFKGVTECVAVGVAPLEPQDVGDTGGVEVSVGLECVVVLILSPVAFVFEFDGKDGVVGSESLQYLIFLFLGK
jgi:hypothetical protein